jgi:hypothetical protein
MAESQPFVARWIRVTFLGWVLGFALVLLLIALSEGVGLGDTQFSIGLGMGAGVGWLQARAIAANLGGRRRWFAASTLGLTAPLAISDAADLLSAAQPYYLPLFIVLGGLLVGSLQWLILRRGGRRAHAWIPATTLAWSLAGSMVFVSDQLIPKIPGIVGALLYVTPILLGGLLLGAASGPVLQRILPPASA